MITMYFDLETTGLCPAMNGIREIACIFEQDGREIDRFEASIDPRTYNKLVSIEAEAMDLSGLTKDDLDGFAHSEKAFFDFIAKLEEISDGHRMTVIGYNSSAFDVPFLKAWFLDNGALPTFQHPYRCAQRHERHRSDAGAAEGHGGKISQDGV